MPAPPECGPTHLLYLHGFRSSPQSAKARAVADWVNRHRPDLHWWCPQLPPSPADAIEQVFGVLASWPVERMAVIGSSLGGFYATAVAECFGCPAVVLNPAVQPARDLAAYIGELRNWHDEERFYFSPAYVDQLRGLTVPQPTRLERYFAVIAKGDELLDWREMTARYAGAPLRLLEGSDHGLSDFDLHWPAVRAFLRLDPPPSTLNRAPG